MQFEHQRIQRIQRAPVSLFAQPQHLRYCSSTFNKFPPPPLSYDAPRMRLYLLCRVSFNSLSTYDPDRNRWGPLTTLPLPIECIPLSLVHGARGKLKWQGCRCALMQGLGFAFSAPCSVWFPKKCSRQGDGLTASHPFFGGITKPRELQCLGNRNGEKDDPDI